MAHGPRNKRLGFGGNPDPDLDLGIFCRNYTIPVLAVQNASHRGFRPANLKLNEVKPALAAVCTVRVYK